METDEKIREDLDRKKRVEYLKTKNNEEYLQSFTKVKTSKSPSKRSEREYSTYQSPYAKK